MNVELGIFARVFTRGRAEDVAAAVAGAGFGLTQLNLSCAGWPTLPPVDMEIDLRKVRSAFSANGVRIWGVSATYNMAHPDTKKRQQDTVRAQRLIEQAPDLGAGFVTLCTGSRNRDDMWCSHPDNGTDEAWRDMRRTLGELLPVAEQAGIRLGVEPDPGTVVADVNCARRLLDELGDDARLVGIVLDPANLVEPAAVDDQERVLRSAFAGLGPFTICVHAKDVLADGGYTAAGLGLLDYRLIFELLAHLPAPVPMILQDVLEGQVASTREFLLNCGGATCAR